MYGSSISLVTLDRVHPFAAMENRARECGGGVCADEESEEEDGTEVAHLGFTFSLYIPAIAKIWNDIRRP